MPWEVLTVAPNLQSLFADSSAAMLYFMLIILLNCAALFMALSQRLRGPAEKVAGRYMLAAGGITAAWLVLMGRAILVIVSNQPSAAIMPPLERAVGAMVMLLAGWAFLSQEAEAAPPTDLKSGNRIGKALSANEIPVNLGIVAVNTAAVVGGGIILVAYALTAVQWYAAFSADPSLIFSQSYFATLWAVATVVIAVGIIVLLLAGIRRLSDVPLKMVFSLLVLGGAAATLLVTNTVQPATPNTDAPGLMRLAFLSATLLFPLIIYRLVVERLTLAIHERAAEATVTALTTISNNLLDTTAERESVTLLRALSLMLERDKPEEIPMQIAQAIGSLLKADVTAVLVIDDAEYADVLAAYDNIAQRPIAAMAFKLSEQPTLQQAIRERRQFVLRPDQTLQEVMDIYTRLDVQKLGPLYVQPLIRDVELIGLLVVGLPYTQRDLRESEKRQLESASPVAARMLSISRSSQRAVMDAEARAMFNSTANSEALAEAIKPTTQRAEAQSNLEVARQQIGDLSGKVRDLQIELDYERGRMAQLAGDHPEGLSVTQRIARIAEERTQLEQERERLARAFQEAQAQLASAMGNDEELYKTAIGLLTQERDDLYNQKSNLEQQLSEIRQRGTPGQAPVVLRDMLTNLSQEKLRLATERDQLRKNLDDIGEQMAALGVEGGTSGLVNGLMQLSQITEERARYKTLAERAVYERTLLVNEIRKVQDRILREKERDDKIGNLETELRRLAQDNEVLIRQRDSLSQPTGWEEERAKLLRDLATLRTDLAHHTSETTRMEAEWRRLSEERMLLLAERDKLLAEHKATQTERDQLLARTEGNRERLQQLGVEGIGQLKTMIDNLTEERSDLEHRLLQAQSMVSRLQQKVKDSDKQTEAAKAGIDDESAAIMVSVAQELRTPLSTIVAYIDLLLGESVGILGELQRQFLQRVRSNSDRLAAQIEDFIRVVAIDTGQLKLRFDKLDLADVIDEAITTTRAQFREKGITLSLDLPDIMPALYGDKSGLHQTLVELLSNAYRASPADSKVEVKALPAPSYQPNAEGAPTAGIMVAVKDYGGGISTDDQTRVFSRFHRADVPLVKGLGETGVGLSIARTLAESHGGTLWLESTLGDSSTFTLFLPLGEKQAGSEGDKAAIRRVLSAVSARPS
jgi:signal transduction histidine kinase